MWAFTASDDQELRILFIGLIVMPAVSHIVSKIFRILNGCQRRFISGSLGFSLFTFFLFTGVVAHHFAVGVFPTDLCGLFNPLL